MTHRPQKHAPWPWLAFTWILTVLMSAIPAAAQCNPSYDPQCGHIAGEGPNVGFSPSGASYALESPSKTIPMTVVFTDEDGLNTGSLQVRLWRNGVSEPVTMTLTTNFDGVRGTATGDVYLGAFGEHVLVAQITDKLGNVGSGRITFTLTQADPLSPVVQNDFQHNDFRDTNTGAMTLTYPGWSYSSMGTPRTTGLMYSSELARPTGFVQLDAYPRGENIKAMSLRVEQWNNGATGTQPLRFPEIFYKVPGLKQRLGAAWWWSAGTYTGTVSKAWAVVRLYRTDNSYNETRLPVRMPLLNESASRYGAGWIVAGVKRLYDMGADGALIHEGDGVLRLFQRVCPTATTCAYQTPEGDFSKLVKTAAGTFLRTYPGGGHTVFSAAGLMTSSSDRFGNTTTVEWQLTQDGTNTPVISRIVDPLGHSTTFAYDASWYLKSITSPGGRTVNVTMNSARAITDITGPVNLRLTYTDRLLTSYNVSYGAGDPGVTTDVAYDSDLRLRTVTAAAVTVNGASVRPQTTFRALQDVIVPKEFWVAGKQTLDNPAEAVISDNVFAEITDPEGHVTKVATDRYGNPTKIVDPMNNVTTLGWSAHGLLERILSPTGSTNKIWDANGNLLQSIVNGAVVYDAAYDGDGRLEFEMNGKDASWYEHGSRGEVLRTWYGKRDDYNRTATRYEYNARYQLTATIDPKGVRTERYYENNPWKNADDERQFRSDGTTATTSWTYDAYSRIRTVKNALDETVTIDYDAADRPTRHLDALGRSTWYHYTGAHLTKVTDTAGKAYDFTYNALGWLESERFPDGGSRTYRYNRDGLGVGSTDRRGQAVTHSYDALHRPLTRTADGVTTTFGYPDHYTSVVTNNESTVTTKRVPGVGSIDSVSSTLGSKRFEIKRVYDPNDALRELGFDLQTWNGATLVRTNSVRAAIQFRPADVTLGATATLTDLGGRTTTVQFDTAGRPAQTILPNGLTQSHSFATDGRLNTTTFSNATVNQKLGASYSWDFLNRLNTRTTILDDRYTNYAYDAVGQVTRYGTYTNPSENCGLSCTVTKIREEIYAYDAAGNRTDRGGAVLAGTNRYTQFNGFTFEYDADGNVTRKYKTGYDQRFTWNALGQLTGVTTNGTLVSYGYDGLGRRVRRTENGVSRYFLYDNDDLLLETDANGEPLRAYTHWPGIDNPHSVRITSNGLTSTYYYVTEGPGNVVGLINEAGNVAAEYRYTPWGEIESASDPTGQPLRFMSREIDNSTGLYYVRARWYDPAMARFASQDPIGLEGGMNTYAYVNNDPVNDRDPSGLVPCSQWRAGFVACMKWHLMWAKLFLSGGRGPTKADGNNRDTDSDPAESSREPSSLDEEFEKGLGVKCEMAAMYGSPERFSSGCAAYFKHQAERVAQRRASREECRAKAPDMGLPESVARNAAWNALFSGALLVIKFTPQGRIITGAWWLTANVLAPAVLETLGDNTFKQCGAGLW